MGRIYNFSAGPSMLPLEVLQQAKEEMTDYRGSGMSVLELSHRSALFMEIIEGAEVLLRDLLRIPSNYQVLFLQGGATLQFSMLPLNLATKSKKIDFINTGIWSKKAISEAEKFAEVHIVASSFTGIPKLEGWHSDADYLHITTNNTIEGTRFTSIPDTNIPIVADMSSNILSEEIDVSQFGVIYAGAQKNIGPAGLTVVIIRNDLLERSPEDCPTYLDYNTHVKHHSLYNTPTTFSIYMAKLVFEWLGKQGGIAEIEKKNKEKAGVLYNFLDESNLFSTPASKEDRSLMNVPFQTTSDEWNKLFIKRAEEGGLVNLKGHRSIGGMRASIYNAMPIEGVRKLVSLMREFEKEKSGSRLNH